MSTAELGARWLPAVRVRERGRAGFFLALGACVTLAQTVGLAGSEALFLSRLGAGWLPATFVLASGTTVLASIGYAFRVGAARNDRVGVELLAVAAFAVAGVALGVTLGWTWTLPALLCLYFAGQAVLVNHFWTLVGDHFDVVASKRVVPLFTAGMSVGGAVGGALALALGRGGSASWLIWAWALGLAAAAALVRLSRSRLRRWGRLEFEEEDETSAASLQAAVRFVRIDPIGRWLVASTLAMVLALFVAQYQYSDVLARSYPDEARLAAFLGLFLAVTNALELVVELALAPWLIRRAGVPRTNLLHPVLTLVSFLVLAASYRLPAALLARMNREMLENALANPVRNLVYNALPLRFRARIRAFLEGIVVYAGMSVAGVILLLAGDLPPAGLSLAGAGLALLYLLANGRVRIHYRRALVDELRARRLDLRALGGELGRREVSELARLWAGLLRSEAERPSPVLLDLPPLLAARGFLEPLRNALGHSHPAVRRASLAALATTEMAGDVSLWTRALGDADPEVRLQALMRLPEAHETALAPELRARLGDDDPRLRAEAARRLGTEGHERLVRMAASGDVREARAALERLPRPLGAEALRRLEDRHPDVRAAALACLARLDRCAEASLGTLIEALGDPSASVRLAAVACLAAHPDPAAREALGRGLADPIREVRHAAVAALARHGDLGCEVARPALDAENEVEVRAALRVLGAVQTRRAREWLRTEQRRRVRAAWQAQLALRVVPLESDRGGALLRLAYGDAFTRELRLAFAALAQLEDSSVVRSVERTLRHAPVRVQGDALEVLANLGDSQASEAMALLLERSGLEERLGSLRLELKAPRDLEELRATGRESSSRWIRLAMEAASVTASARAGENFMERLLFLRQVGLFSGLTLEQLEAIEGMTHEVQFVSGEVIVPEGAPGKELFLVVEGEVAVYKDHGTPRAVQLNTLGAGSYFGEMAVLDNAPRSATVVAVAPTRLLTLDGERLRELVHDMPEIAFEIFRVLAARIRRAEERLSRGDGSAS